MKLTYFTEEVSQDNKVIRICLLAIQVLTQRASNARMLVLAVSKPMFAQLLAML
jgi:hypothetical protein